MAGMLAVSLAAGNDDETRRLEWLRREVAELDASLRRLGGEEAALLASLAARQAARDLAVAEAAAAGDAAVRLAAASAALASRARSAGRDWVRQRHGLAVRLQALRRLGPRASEIAVLAAPGPRAALVALRQLADGTELSLSLAESAVAAERQAGEAAARATLAGAAAVQAGSAAEAAAVVAAVAVTQAEEGLAALRGREDLFRQAASELERAAGEMDAYLNGQRQSAPAGPDPRALRGTLPWPLAGRVLTPFGPRRHPRFRTLVPHNGIAIAGARGVQVRSVAAGTVLFAAWFEGYGRTVILDHGSGVLTVAAHLEEISVAPGAHLDGREIIGSVGDSGSLDGVRLYFEVRADGHPEPPLDWLLAPAAASAAVPAAGLAPPVG